MNKLALREEDLASQILQMRGTRVILDFHLASLYEVETRALKQQVRRNINRFPVDFMFELNDTETNWLVSQNVIPEKRLLGGAKPMAFTEQGVAMLSSVLRSNKAVEVNIAIIRTFVYVRRIIGSNTEIAKKVEEMEKKYDKQFQVVFEAIRKLIHQESKARNPIGYKINRNEEK